MQPVSDPTREPIAVVGVDRPAALWQVLRNGVDAIDRIPAARLEGLR
jgi:acyl transferase domain-containing protein